MNDKISAKHLERAAYVYIRQSTLQQVRQNLESGRRQYALQDRARELGFQEVVVIDEDLGISGAGHYERPGFGRLLAAVCDGRVGAVLAMEASRLARNNRDWHHLIDLCVLTETLVVDAEGIYDPRLLNDRLLLGLKGTMSEFELGILRQRAQEAYRQKVLRGEVLTIVPNKYGRNSRAVDRDVVELVRELALVQPDSYIASTLNRLGYHTGTGKTWNETRVKHLRNYNQIPVFDRGTDRSWLTLEEAAATLKTGVTVVRTMIRNELLPARQVAKHAPWTIKREDLERPEIRNYVQATRPGRSFQYTNDKQTNLLNL